MRANKFGEYENVNAEEKIEDVRILLDWAISEIYSGDIKKARELLQVAKVALDEMLSLEDPVGVEQ